MKTRILSVLLICCLLLTLFPVGVFAANTVTAGAAEGFVTKTESKNGQEKFNDAFITGQWCGRFVGWALDNSKISTETGKKYMVQFSEDNRKRALIFCVSAPVEPVSI